MFVKLCVGNIGPRGCHLIRRQDCHLISLPKTEKASQYSNTERVSNFLVILSTHHVLFNCNDDTCNKKTHKWRILFWSFLWSQICLRPPAAGTEILAGPDPGTGCGTGPAHVTGGRQGSLLGTAGPAGLGTLVPLELLNTGEVAAAESPCCLLCSPPRRQPFSAQILLSGISPLSKCHCIDLEITFKICHLRDFCRSFSSWRDSTTLGKSGLYLSKKNVMSHLNLSEYDSFWFDTSLVKLVCMWDFVEQPYKYIDSCVI